LKTRPRFSMTDRQT